MAGPSYLCYGDPVALKMCDTIVIGEVERYQREPASHDCDCYRPQRERDEPLRHPGRFVRSVAFRRFEHYLSRGQNSPDWEIFVCRSPAKRNRGFATAAKLRPILSGAWNLQPVQLSCPFRKTALRFAGARRREHRMRHGAPAP